MIKTSTIALAIVATVAIYAIASHNDRPVIPDGLPTVVIDYTGRHSLVTYHNFPDNANLPSVVACINDGGDDAEIHCYVEASKEGIQ